MAAHGSWMSAVGWVSTGDRVEPTCFVAAVSTVDTAVTVGPRLAFVVAGWAAAWSVEGN